MRKNFFSYFFGIIGAVASITGSVIGAGFITGKEISVFINGDFSVSGIILFFLFFFFYISAVSFFRGGLLEKIIKPFIVTASIIIASCMTAALNLAYKSIFNDSEYFKIFTIITVILAIIICLSGVGAIGVASSFIMPFVIVFVMILSAVYRSDSFVSFFPEKIYGVCYPILYAGVNCLLSSRIIADSTKKLDAKQRLFVAFFTSFFLSACVLSIAFCINGKSGEMPFIEAVSKNVICIIIIDTIMIFSIFTTLVSAVYSSFSAIKGKTSVPWKIFVSLVFPTLSRFGFSRLVEKAYPLIGMIGIAYFIAIIVSLPFFRKRRRANTSRSRECIELRSTPSRGRA